MVEQWEMSGVLAPNRLWEEGQPTFSGHCIIGDQSYLISGWLKKEVSGEEFISLSFRDMDAAQDANDGNEVKPSLPEGGAGRAIAPHAPKDC